MTETTTMPCEVSATVPDWSREAPILGWDPAKRLIRSIRSYQKWRNFGGPLGALMKGINVLKHRFWTVVTATDIPLNCQLGGGFVLSHGNGVVIHPDAVVGPNCMLFQQVTLVAGVQIGGHVDIGAGAKIIKSVKIGDHALIGANAVVVCDVPAGATAVGVPARIILKKQDKNLV